GSLLLLREMLDKGKAGDAASADVASGKTEIRIGADSVGDVEAALALVKERGLRAVLVGGRDVNAMVPAVRAAGLRVVLRWPASPGRLAAASDAETQKALLAARRNAALLADAGVAFALAPADDRSLPDLLFVAASAARSGLSAERALAAVSIDA